MENRYSHYADQPARPQAAADRENHVRIRASVEERADITIEKLRETLELKASYSTVERVVNKMGYTYKKKSLHATARERTRCAGKTRPMEGKHKA